LVEVVIASSTVQTDYGICTEIAWKGAGRTFSVVLKSCIWTRVNALEIVIYVRRST
jgi:hypothetical protein